MGLRCVPAIAAAFGHSVHVLLGDSGLGLWNILRLQVFLNILRIPMASCVMGLGMTSRVTLPE